MSSLNMWWIADEDYKMRGSRLSNIFLLVDLVHSLISLHINLHLAFLSLLNQILSFPLLGIGANGCLRVPWYGIKLSVG